MKCFKAVNGSYGRGFQIYEEPLHRPYTMISAGYVEEGEKLLLTDPLVARLQDKERRAVFRESSAQILACDIEERGEFWLLPETEESKDDLLVYVVENHWVKKNEEGTVVITFSDEGCDVLLRTTNAAKLIARNKNDFKFSGEALLVRLKPGGWLRVARTTATPRSILSPARVKGDTHTTKKSGFILRHADLMDTEFGNFS